MKKCVMCDQDIFKRDGDWLHVKGQTLWCWGKPASIATPPEKKRK